MQIYYTITFAISSLLLFSATSVDAVEESSSARRLGGKAKKEKATMPATAPMMTPAPMMMTPVPAAKPAVFYALLNRAQGPPVSPDCLTSTALGNAIFTYKDMELCMRLSYDGLSTPELFSHIHGPAMIGEAGGVVFTLSTDPVKFDCFTLTMEQEGYLMAGMLYVNVHTTACAAGEIRGQILM
jgi:CHRD domain